MFNLPKIYALIPEDCDEDLEMFPILRSDQVAAEAERLGLPPVLTESILREIGERERLGDLEEFFLGASMLCLEAATKAGVALLEQDEDACALSLIGHAPEAALAVVGCAKAAPRVRDILARAVEAGRIATA